MWKPDRHSSTPLYLQIADHLQHRIVYGEFPPGSPLPSERKLAAQFGVNRSTVVLAYSELRSQGMIESRPGSRTQVSAHRRQNAAARTPDWQRYAERGSFLPNLPHLRHIREALAADASIVDFASGKLSPDLSPEREINRILGELRYDPEQDYDGSQGFPPLRQALAAFLSRYRGIETTESSVLVTSGSQQSLYLISQCLLSPGDAVAVESPSFTRSLSMFQSAGLRLYRLPVDERGLRPDGIRALHRNHRIKMLFVDPTYQNPTGTLLDPDRRSQLLATASELGLPIVEDDPHSLTAFDGAPPPPLKAADEAASTLYIGSFSKIAASGLRIGWIVGPHSVIRRLADARRQMDLGFSVIPQQIAAAFIQSPHFAPHIDRLRRELAHKRDLMAAALRAELPGLVRFALPEGGLHLWVRIAADVSDGRLLDEALKRGVAFVPGSVYGAEAGYMRLTFARPRTDDIAPGVARLAAALRAAMA